MIKWCVNSFYTSIPSKSTTSLKFGEKWSIIISSSHRFHTLFLIFLIFHYRYFEWIQGQITTSPKFWGMAKHQPWKLLAPWCFTKSHSIDKPSEVDVYLGWQSLKSWFRYTSWERIISQPPKTSDTKLFYQKDKGIGWNLYNMCSTVENEVFLRISWIYIFVFLSVFYFRLFLLVERFRLFDVTAPKMVSKFGIKSPLWGF